ncbi:MAG: glycoside hydrolase family 13 protein [Halothermotrichaceae bacterium]
MSQLDIRHNSFDSFYREPFGAVAVGSQIRLRLSIAKDNNEHVSQVFLHIRNSKADSKTAEDKIVEMKPIIEKKTDRDEKISRSINGEKVLHYQAFLSTPPTPCLLWYYFEIQTVASTYYYGKDDHGYGGEGKLTYELTVPYQITIYSSELKTPAWSKEAVVYQIFVDRFYNGNENGNINNPKKNSMLQSHWDNDPIYIKDEDGKILRWDFFGGNLLGVKKKLDYLSKLGVSVIYLNPVFKAASNHKYDTGDYHQIDEMFGSNQLFQELVEKAAEYGINIILDGVFSHTGSDSIYFNKDDNYDSTGAYQSKDSPYYDWYKFHDYPDDYECWWGVEDLPEVDEKNESYQDFIIFAENSVLKYWMEKGIKGWRLDVADELPEPFLRNFKNVMKECDPESFLLGEVWEDASNKISYGKQRHYFAENILDSVTNYPFRLVLLDFISGRTDAELTHRALMTLYENYPMHNFYSTLNLLSSHDVPRILTEVQNRMPPDFSHSEWTDSASGEDLGSDYVKAVKLLVIWQMTFPGMPGIYYGDEAGLTGGKDPENRKTYPWGRENKELLEWYRQVVTLRNDNDIFKTGNWKSIYINRDIYGYYRQIINNKDVFGQKKENNTALVLFNRSLDKTYNIELDVGNYFDKKVYDILNDYQVKVKNGSIQLDIKPLTTAIFLKNIN